MCEWGWALEWKKTSYGITPELLAIHHLLVLSAPALFWSSGQKLGPLVTLLCLNYVWVHIQAHVVGGERGKNAVGVDPTLLVSEQLWAEEVFLPQNTDPPPARAPAPAAASPATEWPGPATWEDGGIPCSLWALGIPLFTPPAGSESFLLDLCVRHLLPSGFQTVLSWGWMTLEEKTVVNSVLGQQYFRFRYLPAASAAVHFSILN